MYTLHELYKDRMFCDVTLVVEEGHEFPAHRVILAAGSPYFSAMFRNDHLESTQSRVMLNDIETSSLEGILDFLYSSRLSISETNVQSILRVASLLQITSVVEACCEFLRVRLDPENCLGIHQFADIHGCVSLSEVSWKFILEHFQEVVVSEEFLSVPPNHLQALFQSGDIRVQSEVDILDSVLLWYSHNSLERQESLPNLLQYIKFPLIPLQLIQEKLLNKFPLYDPIHGLLNMQLNGLQYKHTSDFDPYLPRKSIGNDHSLIYVVGGETFPGRTTVNTAEEYNPSKDTWTELAPMLTARRGVGVGLLNGCIYVVGGSDSRDALRLVERYDPKSNTWTRVADLNQERSSVSAAVVNGNLYAVGGYDGFSSCLKSIEKYNSESNTWSYMNEMNIPRSMSTVGILNDKLYIIGGYDGASDLSSCEMYDPLTDIWVPIASMTSCRCMSGVGVLGGLLYVVGGCDCARSLRSVDVYDPQANSWSLVAETAEARSGVGVCVVGDKLYALGGYTGSGYCDTVEEFNQSTSQWSVVSAMSTGRRRFGCCS